MNWYHWGGFLTLAVMGWFRPEWFTHPLPTITYEDSREGEN